MRILVTGSAGFIGFHLCQKLIENGNDVYGLDNLNSYYDISLKEARLGVLEKTSSKLLGKWHFFKVDLEDKELLEKLFKDNSPQVVVHLAAQAGVRYSIDNPSAYVNSNLVGFANILECCRRFPIDNLIFASSSSVYGGNTKVPFSEKDGVDHPVSLYAATKKANELMAHSYSHLYGISCTGIRLFTVYGPWGRPDMAPMIFTKAILSNKPIQIFNNGNMSRDFTYIDDVIEIITRLIAKPATPDINFQKDSPDPSSSWNAYKIVNIGNSKPVNLIDFIQTIENELGVKAKKIFCSMQSGDVQATSAETSIVENWTGFKPNTPLSIGIRKFVKWYKEFYNH
ncbi:MULTISPECIES: NAD-dependent epimerase [unclassified Prochlorococcus]|uniref:NAD-dependent epimerase n=1 Tax=unclassified Prochlorococcus TaxID=2627481 RepID=UPI00053374B5|nr:UDP-glucose 4-epimerase [Prochlorococcus sp. MIT 0603]KGG17911.1 UDP-glucose 4-epimerase [Prochlorococcus sp. MIT 0602]